MNGEPVTLSAAGSQSNNGEPLSYQWRLISEGYATLEGSDTDTVTFQPTYYSDPRRGAIPVIVELTVSNGEASHSEQFTVNSATTFTENPLQNYATQDSSLAQNLLLRDGRLYYIDNGNALVNRALPTLGNPSPLAIEQTININSWEDKELVQYGNWSITVSPRGIDFVKTDAQGTVLHWGNQVVDANSNGATRASGAVHGNTLIATFNDASTGIYTVDLANLPDFASAISHPAIGIPAKVAATQGIAAVLSTDQKVHLFDLNTDPQMHDPVTAGSPYCHDIELFGNQLFCAETTQLSRYLIQDDRSLVASGTFAYVGIDQSRAHQFSLSLGDSYLYLNTQGLTTAFNLSADMDLGAPALAYAQTNADRVIDDGQTIAVLQQTGRIATFDIGQFKNYAVNNLQEGKSIRSVAIPTNESLAAAEESGRVNFYDISTPESPLFDMALTAETNIFNIESFLPHKLHVPHDNGFTEFSVEDASNVSQLSQSTAGTVPIVDMAYKSTEIQKGYFSSEQHLAVADGEEDYSTIRFWVDGSQWSEFNVAGLVYEMKTVGDWLYMATDTGLRVADISLPTAATMHEIDFCKFSTYSLDIENSKLAAASGIYLCTATLNESGLPILEESTQTDIGGGTNPAVKIHDGRVFVTRNGIQVFDIGNHSTTRAPELVAHYSSAGSARDIDIHGTTVYIADGSRGLSYFTNTLGNNPSITESNTSPGTVEYTVQWESPVESPGLEEKVLCFVENGSCEVSAVDQENNRAKVVWHKDGGSGEVALRVMVGNQYWFNSNHVLNEYL